MDEILNTYFSFILETLDLQVIWPTIAAHNDTFLGIVKCILMMPLLAITMSIPLAFCVACWWWIIRCWAGKPL